MKVAFLYHQDIYTVAITWNQILGKVSGVTERVKAFTNTLGHRSVLTAHLQLVSMCRTLSLES